MPVVGACYIIDVGNGLAILGLRHTRFEDTNLTPMSRETIMHLCITVGARLVATILILFFLAYVAFVLAVTVTLKRSRQQIEQDYPLDEPPQD